MVKKTVYLVQANYTYSGSAHLPYAVGMLQAFSMHDDRIKKLYKFEELVFRRENPNILVNSFCNPSVVGFSCYVWNYEYNKFVAALIKEKYPDCKIVFGGHHVRAGSEQLKEHSFIDVLIHGEGEAAFRDILLCFAGEKEIEDVSNISYRRGNELIDNKTEPCTMCDYPSPYLNGAFDGIIKNNPQLEFVALLETNRGCPYSCAYCDWGCLSSKLRLFPMERIAAEIEWLCKNKIEICGSTDANFGIIERDEKITDMLVEAKKNTGYPKKFQTSYAKNSNERVFRIGKKFEDSDMSKGVTISYQTMSPVAAKNVLRKNIPVSTFSELMNKYNACGIPTYTELILGLPGETVESFKWGVNELLEAGQHYSLYVHNCELLPCSTLADIEYSKKYKIAATKIPLNEPHHEPFAQERITEFSRIVTSTVSMTNEDWIEMIVFSYLVQGFHHLGLLRFIAIYLYYSQGIRYDDFYSAVLSFFHNNPDTVAGRAIKSIEDGLRRVIELHTSLTAFDERFGSIDWPFEELLFLRTIYERDSFYSEIVPLIYDFCVDKKIADELLKYQMYMIKYPEVSKKELTFSYDFPLYFDTAISGGEPILLEKKTDIIVDDKGFPMTWEDYARFVVWYGRKSGSNFFSFRKEER